MAAGFWSIVEAHRPARISSQSEAAGHAAGLLTWILAGGLFVAAKAAIDEIPRSASGGFPSPGVVLVTFLKPKAAPTTQVR
jgi:hypothetical protein